MIGVKLDDDKYELFINYNSEVNFIIPYKNIAFISEKPIEVKWKNNRLHSDGNPAIKYLDGYSLWALNGVSVPKYLAETPEGNLDIDFFNKEKNAEVRTEFIKKFGIERMESFGKEIDSWEQHNTNKWWVKSEYKLIDMASIFNSINYAPHLKMKNQTTKTWHLEPVHPDCKTISEALRFRHNGRTNTKTVTIK